MPDLPAGRQRRGRWKRSRPKKDPRPARGPCARGRAAGRRHRARGGRPPASSSRLGGGLLIGGVSGSPSRGRAGRCSRSRATTRTSRQSRGLPRAPPPRRPRRRSRSARSRSRGTNGSKAAGVMTTLHRRETSSGSRSRGWLRGEEQKTTRPTPCGSRPPATVSQRLGFAQPVDRQRPARDDRPADRGPRQVPSAGWRSTNRSWSRASATASAEKPGPVVLRGALPSS